MIAAAATETSAGASVATRAGALLRHQQVRIYSQTDRLFALLFLIQWVAGIGAAVWLSPRAWWGSESAPHIHVWAAVYLGGVIAFFPIALVLTRPARASTRHVIAVAQMLMSALLIQLTGGRIETHFHVFGSLAFLSFYRDWRILVPATVVDRRGSFPARMVVAAVGLWSAAGEPVALGGARRLGNLREHLSHGGMRPKRARDASRCGAISAAGSE